MLQIVYEDGHTEHATRQQLLFLITDTYIEREKVISVLEFSLMHITCKNVSLDHHMEDISARTDVHNSRMVDTTYSCCWRLVRKFRDQVVYYGFTVGFSDPHYKVGPVTCILLILNFCLFQIVYDDGEVDCGVTLNVLETMFVKEYVPEEVFIRLMHLVLITLKHPRVAINQALNNIITVADLPIFSTAILSPNTCACVGHVRSLHDTCQCLKTSSKELKDLVKSSSTLMPSDLVRPTKMLRKGWDVCISFAL